MEINKQEVINDILERVELACNAFAKKSYTDSDNYMLPLPATKIEVKNILSKIITALPPHFFSNSHEKITL